jgi:SNF2 family DNA or RNA helicase
MTRRIYTPRGYQTITTGHIYDVPRCAIWAGMGLGKTVSTLTALDGLFLSGESRPALVLAPLRVAKTTWPEEARKWNHLRQISVMPIVGGEAERRMALKHDASIYTTNYEQLPWLVEHFGDRWPFGTVVSDESTKLKSFRLRQGGKRAQALARVAHAKVDRFIELTGTCAPNGLQDLWGQMWFIDGGERLGRTFSSFKDRWFQKSHNGFGVLALPHAQAEIQEKLKDICLTIDAADWFDLEEPIVNNIYIDLPPKSRALYDDMEKRMFMELEGSEVEVFGAAARTIKCLQIANGFAYVDDSQNWKPIHDEKIAALDDIIEEAAGAPVLVAYHFKPDLIRLMKAFPNGRVLDSNPQTITDWNAGKIPILFAHPQSAGHGLNLQDGGNILVFFAHWWNLEERLQIIERIGPVRQMQAGHHRPVFIHNIIARDTVDEMVIERVETKKEVQDILLEAMKKRGVSK